MKNNWRSFLSHSLMLFAVFLVIFSTNVLADDKEVFRFLHNTKKVHFYTASETEKANVITNLPSEWEYEGIAFDVADGPSVNTKAVYRFLHRQNKVHFYTASTSERDHVQSQLSSIWKYEGITFYAYKASATDAKPVFRFLNRRTKLHFYTGSQKEKDSIIINLPSEWEYEGVAYHAKTNSKPPQVAEDCPISIGDCVPCTASDPLCRIESGKSTGYQGWSCQNNNPGNIRFSSFRNSIIEAEGFEASCGERGGYMVFRDYTIGRNGLKAYIKAIAHNRHGSYLPVCQNGGCNLKEFFGIYAPAGDQNDPDSYANNVADWIGVNSDTTTLNWIINNKLNQFVSAIQRQEGWFEL